MKITILYQNIIQILTRTNIHKINNIVSESTDNIFKQTSPEETTKRKQEYALIKINKLLKEKGTQNPDGSWDINGDVNIRNLGLTEIPVKFNKVSGYFDCSENNLISLKGAPNKIGGYFKCSDNNLTSLIGAPKEVGGNFYCYNNNVKFTIEDVKKYSNVKGKIYTWNYLKKTFSNLYPLKMQ